MRSTKNFITALCLILFLCGTVRPARAAERIPQTFTEYGYPDRTASTMFGALEYYFPIPENLTLKESASLSLIVSHSPLLKADRSTMTVNINGVAVYSAFLDETNLNRATVNIPLPVSDFQDATSRREGYVVLIQFFMRLTDLVCEETSNPALWATIYKESALTFDSQPRANPNDLALLPYPFIVKNVAEVSPIAFHFSAQPSSAEVNAAANVAAYLGANSIQGMALLSASVDSNASGSQPNIVVQTTQGASSLSISETNNQATLTLEGEAPLLASEALLHPELYNQLRGQSVQVRKQPDSSLNKRAWAWKQDAATFAQLGAADQTVRGVGAQSMFLNFIRPSGWNLTMDSVYLDLHLTRSPLLLEAQSGVKVRINGVDVGAIGYNEKPDSNGFYHFKLPADTLNVGADGKYTSGLAVELVIEQQLQQQSCEPIYADNAWTTVHADSYFYFPHETVDLPDLSVFPYPFMDPNRADPIEIVLPSAPNSAEIESALALAQLIGKYSFDAAPAIHISYADEVKEISGNAILIGAAERNRRVKEAEAQLPQERRGLVQPVVTNDAVGNLKEIKSPWANGKWILIISGASDLNVIASALGGELPSAALIAVREDGSAEALFRDTTPPDVPQAFQQTRPPLLPQPQTWQVVLGVIVVTALVVLVVILIYRRRNA